MVHQNILFVKSGGVHTQSSVNMAGIINEETLNKKRN